MGEVSARAVVGLLAEEERLRVFAALVLGAADMDEVGRVTGLGAREVGKALLKLREAGLVDGMAVQGEVIKAAARGEAEAVEEFGYADKRVETVVRTFVKSGKLTGMPAQDAKRRLVLEHVVQSFEPGVRYPEKEVDVVLRAWCEGGGVDFVSVRRYLVDAGLLSREGGEYWRSGGYTEADQGARRGAD